MKTLPTALAVLFVSATMANAQPDGVAGPPPALKVVANLMQDKGEIFFRETVYQQMPVTREVEVLVNGQLVRKTVTEVITVAQERIVVMNVAKVRIITPDGKKVAIENVWKKLNKNAVVAFSGNNETPAAAYLRVLHADTLVIIPLAEKK